MPLWGGRFSSRLNEQAWELNTSLPVDQRMAIQDVDRSLAWAEALRDRGIISPEEERKITSGLRSIEDDIRAGRFEFSRDREDIHMNIEAPIGGAPHAYNTTHAKEDEKDGRLVGLNGDSYVLIVTFDKDGVAPSEAIHQYGNVNRPGSRHYADQAPLFVKRQLRTSWLSDSNLLSNMDRAYHPGAEIP